jgi:predicted membrane chloride channel (bestrophin family)
MDQAVQLTAALKSEMQRLIDNAEPVFAAARLRALPPPAISLKELAPQAIEELSSLLRTQSLSAVDRFKSMAPQLRRLMGEALYEQMRRHVDNLQFDDATNDLQTCSERRP